MDPCPYCGATVWEDESHCSYCGRTLRRLVEQAHAQQPAAPRPAVARRPTRQTVARQQPNALDLAIGRYVRAGYSLSSRTETAATLECHAPVAVSLVIGWFLLFWVIALVYALVPKVRKSYRAHLQLAADGRVLETGSTLEVLERDKGNRQTGGWIMVGTIVLIVFIVQAASTF